MIPLQMSIVHVKVIGICPAQVAAEPRGILDPRAAQSPIVGGEKRRKKALAGGVNKSRP